MPVRPDGRILAATIPTQYAAATCRVAVAALLDSFPGEVDANERANGADSGDDDAD
jgi:hypothetical protein